MDNNIAVLVCTCDSYFDVLPPFFYFFKKYWPTCPYPIFINTESKIFTEEGLDLKTIQDFNKKDTWSQRMKKALKKIPYEYVIVILDDFFLLDYVDDISIKQCADYLKQDRTIAYFSFRQVSSTEEEDCSHPGFRRRCVENDYWVNLLPGLWRKKCLQNLLSPYEDPWQFEWFGTQRAKLSSWKFYELLPNRRPVFSFNISMIDGYGVCQGKWMKGNVELFQKNGLEFDFSRRGFFNLNNIKTEIVIPKRTIKDKINYCLWGGMNEDMFIDNQWRMSFGIQIVRFIKYPGFFMLVLKNKIKYFCGKDEGKKITIWDGNF